MLPFLETRGSNHFTTISTSHAFTSEKVPQRKLQGTSLLLILSKCRCMFQKLASQLAKTLGATQQTEAFEK